MRMLSRARTKVTAAVGAVALLGAAATAHAATIHYATTVDATGAAAAPAPSSSFIEYGRVHSPKAACRSGRKLTMVAHYPNGTTKVLDTTTSSHNGAYAMVGDFAGSDGGVIKVAKKTFGTKGHLRVCDRASVPAD